MSQQHGVYQSKRRDSKKKEMEERRKSSQVNNDNERNPNEAQMFNRTSIPKENEQNNDPENPDIPRDLFTEKPNKDNKNQDQQMGFAASFCLSCCATKQLAIKKNRKSYIAVILRELCIYLLYLVVLSLVAVAMISNNNYYFSKVISDEFLEVAINRSEDRTFKTTVSIDDFWNYLEYVLPVALKKFDPFQNQENELKGISRLIQLRVKSGSCPASKKYSSSVRKCYPEYSQGKIEKTKNLNKENCPSTACTYTKDHTFRSPHWGTLALYSDGGGYMVDLSHNEENNRKLIGELKKAGWIDPATRAVFLDFTMHNHNLNLFCVAEIIWEFPPTGGVLTHSALRPISHSALRPLDIVDDYDYFIIVCDILFVLFTLYYTLQEIIEIVSMGFREYLKDPWSYLDGAILLMSYCCFGIFIYQVTLISEDELMRPNKDIYHAHYDELVFWAIQNDNLIGICLFLAWAKIFKYISFNRTMSQLSCTLSRCAKDIAGFALMFFIVFFSFAQLGYLLFGPQIYEFSTFGESVCTLLRLILGDFDYRKLETANRILGPIFFVCYIFFVFFVLLNMFLAIINDTYSEVKAEIQIKRNEFEATDFIKAKFNDVREKICKQRSENVDANNRIKLAVSDGQISYAELRDNLADGNFTEIEIEMFLARYELDQDRALDDDEIQHILNDMEHRRIPDEVKASEKFTMYNKTDEIDEPYDNNNNTIINEDVGELRRRIDELEITNRTIIDKIELFMDRVEDATLNTLRERKRSY